MPDAPDPALLAQSALIAAGIHVEPVGEEMGKWVIGDFVMSDADLVRLALSRGLMEDEDG